ncbi:hypothetical protein H5410_008568 [Solanum commersonii]|uniref:Uncharacterized protein n=1 Tax=Solanum commersonii TaxID=4109 RepID=A0A9J6AFB1_SOLCO|nr:hypothetical protein H5410_008568 [Solanum commersonii]
MRGRGLLFADQQLMANEKTVTDYTIDDGIIFRTLFAHAMAKLLSNFGVLTGSEGEAAAAHPSSFFVFFTASRVPGFSFVDKLRSLFLFQNCIAYFECFIMTLKKLKKVSWATGPDFCQMNLLAEFYGFLLLV